MEILPEVSAPSIREAISIVNAENAYRFTNSWLIDVDDRIKQFSFQDNNFIAKRSSFGKAQNEIANAQQAHHRLNNSRIGGYTIGVAVPELVHFDQETDDCYLVSEYVGPDMNEQYYKGKQSALRSSDWLALQRLLILQGISYDGFLPRNTIVNSSRVTLIDWERARFLNRPVPPDSLTRTTTSIGWSYMFGTAAVNEMLAGFPLNSIDEPDQIDFEHLFASIANYTGSPTQLREHIQSIAIAAEADRGHISLPYKIDDAFHVVGELMPRKVEVLMDILFALCDDTAHYSSAQRMAATAKALHAHSKSGYTEQIIQEFRQRCAKIAIALVSSDSIFTTNISSIDAVDAVAGPMDQSELADQIYKTLRHSYPDTQSNNGDIKSIANILHTLAYLASST